MVQQDHKMIKLQNFMTEIPQEPVLTSIGAVLGSCATVTATSTDSLVVAGFTTSLIVITSALSITGLKSVVLMSATVSLMPSLFNSLGLSFHR